MTLVRWRPFNDVLDIQNELNRAFDSLARGPVMAPVTRGWYPAVDLVESEEEFRLVAEIPGVHKDDVKISLTDSVLTLRGEKKSSVESKGDQWHQVERTYGSFERSFQLSAPVDAEKIKARYTDGVLTVSLPKAENAKPREIKIDF